MRKVVLNVVMHTTFELILNDLEDRKKYLCIPFWSTRPTRMITIFARVVCPSVLTSKSLKTKQLSRENSDRYWQDCGAGRVDHWWDTCLFYLFALKGTFWGMVRKKQNNRKWTFRAIFGQNPFFPSPPHELSSWYLCPSPWSWKGKRSI